MYGTAKSSAPIVNDLYPLSFLEIDDMPIAALWSTDFLRPQGKRIKNGLLKFFIRFAKLSNFLKFI
jgi:hypothetical protein